MFGILYACTYMIGFAYVLVCVGGLHDSIKQLQEMFMWCLYGKSYDRHVVGNET